MATKVARFDTFRLFLWGYLKSKVYQSRPNDREELKERIRTEIAQITPEVLVNVRDEFIARLSHCIIAEGHQFEHLI